MKKTRCVSFLLTSALTLTMLPANFVQAKATENQTQKQTQNLIQSQIMDNKLRENKLNQNQPLIQSQIADNQLPKNTLSQILINKAAPFIKTTQDNFYISKKGYSLLNSTEIKIILAYVNDSNMLSKDNCKTGNLNIIRNVLAKLPKSAVYASYMRVKYT